MAQAAMGLSAVHAAGIISRNVKGSNVLFSRAGGALFVRLADYAVVPALCARRALPDLLQLALHEGLPYAPLWDAAAAQGAAAAAAVPLTPAYDVFALAVVALEAWDPPAFQRYVADRADGGAAGAPELPADMPCRALWQRCLAEAAAQRPAAAAVARELRAYADARAQRQPPGADAATAAAAATEDDAVRAEVADAAAAAPLCLVCSDAPRSARLPCGHMNCCDACVAGLCRQWPARCPICRAPFQMHAVRKGQNPFAESFVEE
jgi:hypothetical protein